MPAYETRHLEEASRLVQETNTKHRERIAKALAKSERTGREKLTERLRAWLEENEPNDSYAVLSVLDTLCTELEAG